MQFAASERIETAVYSSGKLHISEISHCGVSESIALNAYAITIAINALLRA